VFSRYLLFKNTSVTQFLKVPAFRFSTSSGFSDFELTDRDSDLEAAEP